MNKFLLNISAFTILFITACQTSVSYEGVESAGKFFPGEENELNGNSYVLADDKYMDIVQQSTDAYNNRDWNAMKLLYRDEFVEDSAEGMTNYFENEVESLDMNITAMLPVKIKGSGVTRVLTWAVEDRQFKNGQKERHNLFEIYYIDEEDKLGGWNQWYRINPDPELTSHGLPEGGKFVGRNPDNEYSGRPFVFSNRGEVEKLESFLEAANNMDADAALEFLTNPFTFNDSEMTHNDLRELMAGRKSQNWKAWSMIPIKIKDTDPSSGLIVWSTARVETNEGDVWEADLSETYFFDLDGKISSVTQYAKPLSSSDDSE
jgi:hypothetical protein